MNRNQKLNRPKRLRIASQKHGNFAPTSGHHPDIAKQATDKRPKVQRVGDYYVKVKQGSRKQYLNVVPRHKLIRKPLDPNVFATLWDNFKAKLGL